MLQFCYIFSIRFVDFEKVIKPTGKNAFRRRVEMLIGMAIKGYVFVNPLESLDEVVATRAAKAQKTEEKAAKQADKAAVKAAKQTAEPAGIQQGKQQKQSKKKETTAKQPTKGKQGAKQQETAQDTKQRDLPIAHEVPSDDLPTFENIFDDLTLPAINEEDNAA